MKKLLFLTLLIPLLGIAQTPSETHNFRRFDTTLSLPNISNPFGAPYQWILEIEIPVDYFTVNSPDTASRIMMITMPGQGQQGSNNYANLSVYGFGFWRRNGWDGGITISNGKHYPILVTIAFVNNNLPQADQYNRVLDSLIKWYHPRTGKVAVTGFSQGSFTNGALIKFEQTAGAETGMKKVSCAALFEGEPDALPSPYNTWDRQQVAYKVWAAKYGGHYFYLEGSGSDNFRDGWKWSGPMNDTVPGCAYFSYETLGGGAHCCWNSMWDPSATNWNSVTPPALGPNNGPSQAGTNTMGNYKIGDNVYTWMFRNSGDTTLVGSTGPSGVLSVQGLPDSSFTLPVSSFNARSIPNPISGTSITAYAWSQISGPISTTINSPTAQNTFISGLTSAGTYKYRIQVTDNISNTAADTITMTVLSNMCRNFYWDTTQTNVVLTGASFSASPAIHRCDTINVLYRATNGGYRSVDIHDLGLQNDPIPGEIFIRGVGWGGHQGAAIAPSTVNVFGNLWDNNNWVHVDSFSMISHPDPFIFRHTTNGYSHHIKFTHINLKSNGGFFPSSTITHSLPNWGGPFGYNGGVDTVNCMYDWSIDHLRTDSIYGSGSGLTAMWFGGPNKNSVWLKVSVTNSSFDHYSSSSNPSSYIFFQNVFPIIIANDSFSNLGNNTGTYVGHAAMIFGRGSMYDVHNIHYGPHCFANGGRDFGAWDIPGMESFFTNIDPTYDGISRAYNILMEHQIKYGVWETRNTSTDTSANPFMRSRNFRYISHITAYSMAVGVGYQPYNSACLDAYTGPGDTVYLHNSVYAVVNDTTWGLSFTQPLTIASGTPGFVDTAGNYKAQTFALSGLADTVRYLPVRGGPLYRTGRAAKPFPTFDIENKPRVSSSGSPVDKGANGLNTCDCLIFTLPTKITP